MNAAQAKLAQFMVALNICLHKFYKKSPTNWPGSGFIIKTVCSCSLPDLNAVFGLFVHFIARLYIKCFVPCIYVCNRRVGTELTR